jgi:hypothetical protein
MKSYKVRFSDGKNLTVNSDDKITAKKLSSNFLTFYGSADNTVKVYLNTSYIVSIEEQKSAKTVKEKKPKEIVVNKEPGSSVI